MMLKRIEFDNHAIFQVKLEDGDGIFQLALEQSAKKQNKVHTADASGKERSADKVNKQNFLGTLADIVCARILEQHFKERNLDICVTRYDDVRKDDYQYPDQYDIKLSVQENEYLVEVRSSACVLMSLGSMIRKWQILGPYVSSSKGATETVKPFYLRPIYHLSGYQENWKTRYYNSASAQDLIKNNDLQLYFVGGATEALLEQKGRNEAGEELKQGKADFRVLNIQDGLDAEKMLQTLERLTLKDLANN